MSRVISFLLLGRFLERISECTINLVTRFGGLMIATIGVQLAFNGVKSFFELGG